jgi:amino acid transporter
MINEFVMVPIVVGIIFFSVVSVFRIIFDYQLRRKMIQMGHVDENSVAILNQKRNNRLDSLKWGLIILFAGIGFVIISIPSIETDSPLPFGIMSICIAVGFLLYFVISKRVLESENEEKEKAKLV